MLNLAKNKDYAAPQCEILLIAPAEILCSSSGSFGGSTEDLGDLEDIFGNNN